MMYESMGLSPDEAAQLDSFYNDNQRSALSDTGLLRGREAEVADLQRALGMTDETITEERRTKLPDAPPPRKKKKGFFDKLKSTSLKVLDPSGGLSKLDDKIMGYGGKSKATVSDGYLIEQIVKDNPEYAAAVGKLSDAQKSLLAEQIRAEMDQGGRELDYNQKLSEFGTTAAKRRAAELDAGKALDQADASIIGGTDSDVLNARRGEIDQGVGRAIADTQGANSRTLNQSIRAGLRYGMSKSGIDNQTGQIALDQASQTATAANTARELGIGKVRGLAETNLNLRRNIRDDVTRQKSLDWAKKLDSTGIAKGLPGASAGAYGLALNAGNSAVGNQIQPGAQFTAARTAANGITMSGRQLLQGGMANVLSSNTGLAQAGFDNQQDMYGTMVGAGFNYASSRR